MSFRGTVVFFDSANFKATIRPFGSEGGYVEGVRVSRAIPEGQMTAGRTVIVDGEGFNPQEMVVIAVL